MLKNVESMLHGYFFIQRFLLYFQCFCLIVLSVGFVAFNALDALDKITSKCLMKWKDIAQHCCVNRKNLYQTISIIGTPIESIRVGLFLISCLCFCSTIIFATFHLFRYDSIFKLKCIGMNAVNNFSSFFQ